MKEKYDRDRVGNYTTNGRSKMSIFWQTLAAIEATKFLLFRGFDFVLLKDSARILWRNTLETKEN